MRIKKRIGLPLLGSVAIGLALSVPGVASAQGSASTTYMANLAPVPLNGANSASGMLMLTLNGNQANITEHVSGLASTFMNAPYPHVQHIHGGANGVCPTASADANHDGVLSTTEGQPAYGPILTTLSVSGDTTPASGTDLKIAPSGSSFDYSRSITLDAATVQSIKAGTAVIVVHGLDPATAPPAATSSPSDLVPSLPLAATSPALCATLAVSQMSAVPNGAPHTGGGSTSGPQDLGLLAVGGALAVAGSGALVARKRLKTVSSRS